MEKARKELKELTHEPVPGYRPVFYVLMVFAAMYLAIIFLKTF